MAHQVVDAAMFRKMPVWPNNGDGPVVHSIEVLVERNTHLQ